MALSTEYIHAYELADPFWRPTTPDMQRDVQEICDRFGISAPDLHAPADTSDIALSEPLSEENIALLSTLFSGFEDPLGWHEVGGGLTATSPGNDQTRLVDSSSSSTVDHISPLPFKMHASLDPSNFPAGHSPSEDAKVREPDQGSVETPEDSTLTCASQSGFSRVQSSPLAMPHIPDVRRHSKETSLGPIAPSRRRSTLDGHTVQSGPYPPETTRSFYQRHFSRVGSPSPSVAFIGQLTGGAAKEEISILRVYQTSETAQDDRITSPVAGQGQQWMDTFREGRIPVPLGEWRPKRAPKAPEALRTIEFFSREAVTGEKLFGTFLGDRFREDTGRAFLFENDLPFPGKTSKGLNLRVLWPGYPEFSKKISIHKLLQEVALREVRDWVYNALSDFMRNPGMRQGDDCGFWRVGEDNGAVHVDDLVLVHLRQVGKGTWVPELDLCSERTPLVK